jgi:predicted site-specific integrase-resolvase
VSSPGQKDDLASQVRAMEEFCLGRGLAVDSWITEVGGGMNLKRKKLLAVMDAIERGEIAVLVIAHKDRLARFGFEYLEHVAVKNGCTILIANQESLSPQEEMVQDLLSIVHTFSCRLYGLRRYEKALKDELGAGGR